MTSRSLIDFSFEPGTVVVDDRGYNDYRLFAKWIEDEVYFVTRMKDNALYTVVENRTCAAESLCAQGPDHFA